MPTKRIAVCLAGMLVTVIVSTSAQIIGGTFTDSRDGKTYRTVMIGGQTWMAENLNYLPKIGKSWCYNDEPVNCEKYGRLYDWNTALSACPQNWRLPSDAELTALADAVGSATAGATLKSKTGWLTDHGMDKHGFSALPGGLRFPDERYFGNVIVSGYWWSATEYGDNDAYYRDIVLGDRMRRGYSDKSYAYSVRCLLD